MVESAAGVAHRVVRRIVVGMDRCKDRIWRRTPHRQTLMRVEMASIPSFINSENAVLFKY